MSRAARRALTGIALAAWLGAGGCAQEARTVYVFETSRVLDGSPPRASYIRYENNQAACETQRSTLIFELTRSDPSASATISARCYPAILKPSGSGLATERAGAWMIFGSFTRDPAPCVPSKEILCHPATLTPTAR